MATVTSMTADAIIAMRDDLQADIDGKSALLHAASHADGGDDEVTLALAQITGLVAALAAKASTTHAATHASAGSDPVTLAQSQITSLVSDLAGKASTAHASTHVTGGSDELTLTQARVTNLVSDLAAKASTTHASTHASAGSDPVTLAQSQITGLTAALAALLSIASTLASGTTTLLSSKVTADTQQRLIIDASGKHTWGSGSATGDTTLFRRTANVLRTEDTIEAEVTFKAVVPTGGSTGVAFASFYEGDSSNSFEIENDGKLEWGDGGGTMDTNLYRDSAGTVKTDGDFRIGAALRHLGSSAGFFNTAAISKPTVSGSRGGNAALASLCTALANLGLITNSTS